MALFSHTQSRLLNAASCPYLFCKNALSLLLVIALMMALSARALKIQAQALGRIRCPKLNRFWGEQHLGYCTACSINYTRHASRLGPGPLHVWRIAAGRLVGSGQWAAGGAAAVRGHGGRCCSRDHNGLPLHPGQCLVISVTCADMAGDAAVE
eukprot:scaffold210596_cov19-Tisochrysis_lutea.AAC.1